VGTLFSIELNERVYTLKAADGDEAEKWVEVLNQLKVGRGRVGTPSHSNMNDFLISPIPPSPPLSLLTGRWK
jgi:hypothetical protein